MSTLSFSLSTVVFGPPDLLFPSMQRRSSTLLTFEEDKAFKFLLLFEFAVVEDNETLSLVIESVDDPMFELEISKLLLLSFVIVDKFGDPPRPFCDVISLSFSLRYEVIKSWRKKNASASTVTNM